MEMDAGVNSAEDVVEIRYAEQARRAIYSLAKQVLRWKAKNQTAVQITEKTALIRTYRGWEERPAAEVSEKLFRRFAEVTASYVEGPVATPLRPLGSYITRHIDELASEERKSLALLGQYSQQADRVCATSTNPEFAKLKELLRAAKEQPPQLGAEDILDILGWN
jgi:protoheme ferro-lyase